MTLKQPKQQIKKQSVASSTPRKKKTLRSVFGAYCVTFGRSLLKLFVPLGGPRITQLTRNGQICWEVYDPHTETTIVLDSENDVHIWLDQQKYRQ